jgi:hypothetical protein
VTTSTATQATLVIPPGGSLCVSVTLTHQTGGKTTMLYDGATGTASTNVTPPSIIVPESLLPFAGVALVLPLLAARIIRKRA